MTPWLYLFWVWVGVIHTSWCKKLTVRRRYQRISTKLSLHKADIYPKNISNKTHEWYSAKRGILVLELWTGHEKRDEKFECVVYFAFHWRTYKVIYSVILLRTQMESLTIALDTGVKRSKIITQRGVDVGGFCVAQWAVSISGGLVVWIPSGILMKTLHSLPQRSFLLLCSFAVWVNGKMNIQHKTRYEITSFRPS